MKYYKKEINGYFERWQRLATLRSQDQDNLSLCHKSPSLAGTGPNFGNKSPSPAVSLGLFFYQTLLIEKNPKTEPFFSLTGSVNALYGK